MTLRHSGAGRGLTRPALVFALLAVAGGIGFAALRRAGPERGPIAVANPAASPATDSLIGSVRHVFNSGAPERLIPDSVFPTKSTQLLWFEGRGVTRFEDESVVLDRAGGVVRFDSRLTPHRARLQLAGRVPVSVAAATGGGFWVTDADGMVHRTAVDGRIVQTTATPFDFPAVAADRDGGAWLVRSTSEFAYRLAREQDPLLLHLDQQGAFSDTLGSIALPEHVLLAELANSGHIAVAGEAVYYAPFIRDEVVAFSLAGDTLWAAHRGLPQSSDEPRFEIGDDGPMIDYAPVNLGIAVGPDGLLYVLSIPGFTTQESRLDALDPETGTLKRSATLPSPLPTVAADGDGRVYLLETFRLLTGIAPREREAFAPFDLEQLEGERMTLEDLGGRVVLVNFWASWCAPCRTEMPALDSLRHSIDDRDFAFITMNEDVATGDAAAFLDEFGFDFPVLLGRGKLRAQYHYIGLPFTVLLDREGRVVQRWSGFAGEQQIAAIRAVVVAELARGGGPSHGDDVEHGHQGQMGHEGQ